MRINTQLSFFLLSVAVACAAPILHARQEAEAPPQGEPLPSPLPLDFESLIASSPLNGVYKMIKEEVKVDLPNKGRVPGMSK